VIGRDISWTDIVGQVFRIVAFDKAGTTVDINGKVHPKSPIHPYGYLQVESPILSNIAILPVCHHDDFLLAYSIFDEPHIVEALETQELLVTYAPRHKLPGGLMGISHGLHYVLVPSGTLNQYYEFNSGVHIAHPAPEKLFGRFIYEGELKVQTNPAPSL